MKYLVTGAAGFIGSHVSQRLLKDGHQVTGIDNLNDYYDVNLKQARLDFLQSPCSVSIKSILLIELGWNNFSFLKNLIVLSILLPKLAFATHLKTRMRMLIRTFLAF